MGQFVQTPSLSVCILPLVRFPRDMPNRGTLEKGSAVLLGPTFSDSRVRDIQRVSRHQGGSSGSSPATGRGGHEKIPTRAPANPAERQGYEAIVCRSFLPLLIHIWNSSPLLRLADTKDKSLDS